MGKILLIIGVMMKQFNNKQLSIENVFKTLLEIASIQRQKILIDVFTKLNNDNKSN